MFVGRAVGVAIAALSLIAGPAQAAELAAPKPTAPADGATVQALPPFGWGKVAKAVSYEVQVAADARFGSIVTGRSIKTANTVATVPKAVPDGKYFWRVRGVDAKGKAGKWSTERDVVKAWTDKPALQAPTGGLRVEYPSQPLILRWSDVDNATKYVVTVASDPSLAQSVIGNRVVETSATNYALPNALAPGTYYWAIQPLNAQGHRGARSDVGKFVWGWNSAVSLADPVEMRGDARVAAPALSDPELAWEPVPGASAYEVQVNFFEDFSKGSEVETATTIGTRYSPTTLLPNNSYYWRVRPLDVNGNPSEWSTPKRFVKTFDAPAAPAPTVPGLHIRDNEADPFRDRGTSSDLPIVQHPLFEWDPVPGASGYEIQAAPYKTTSPKFCDWSLAKYDRTPNTAWSMIERADTHAPGPTTWAPPFEDRPSSADPNFVPGQAYCVRVMAIANFQYSAHQDDVISEWTYIHNGPGAPASRVSTDSNAPAFVYEAPAQPAVVDVDHDPRMDADDYLFPPHGSSHEETPVLRWKAVPGAKGYWVIVARDPEFTTVPEIVFVTVPQHAPRTTFRDESTDYWWVVIPSMQDDGTQVPTGVAHNNKRSFHKASKAPSLLEPAAGTVITGQPRFHWTGTTGAKEYILQVSTDPTFKDSSRQLDTVTTASTAYTPTKTYPVDTELHWRVTAVAAERIEGEVQLRPSAAGTFRRTLPVPVTAADNVLGGSTIPALRWAPVPGAVEYDVLVDYVDGKQNDFTVKSAAFTPVTWFGTGVWRWQVRAVFPGDVHGAYSPPVQYARFIPTPENAQAERTKDRVLITWKGLRNVREYTIEIATDSSFGRIVERGSVDGTAFAPELSRPAYASGGTLYWRVAAVDDGGNVGAFATGTLTLARRLVATQTGAKVKRGRTSIIYVKVADAGRVRVSGAKVVVAGAGMKKISRKTGKTGRIAIKIRPRRKGTITITATKKGYAKSVIKLRVR